MDKLITNIVSLYSSEDITIYYHASCAVINTGKNKITIKDKNCQKGYLPRPTKERETSNKKLTVTKFGDDGKTYKEIYTNFIIKTSGNGLEVIGKCDGVSNKVIDLDATDISKAESMGLKYIAPIPSVQDKGETSNKRLAVTKFGDDGKTYKEIYTNFIIKTSGSDFEVIGKIDGESNKVIDLDATDIPKAESMGLKYIPCIPAIDEIPW